MHPTEGVDVRHDGTPAVFIPSNLFTNYAVKHKSAYDCEDTFSRNVARHSIKCRPYLKLLLTKTDWNNI